MVAILSAKVSWIQPLLRIIDTVVRIAAGMGSYQTTRLIGLDRTVCRRCFDQPFFETVEPARDPGVTGRFGVTEHERG
jgi:hypothetical protein